MIRSPIEDPQAVAIEQPTRPHISMKVAMSLDARIATRTGDARWLSDKEARIWGHQLRTEVDAILVGANTVIADDPALNVRHVQGKDPLRVVLDSQLRTPLSSQLYQPPLAAGTLIATTMTPESLQRQQAFLDAGVSVLSLPPNEEGRVSLPALLAALALRGVERLLVEGGGEVHGAFLQAQLVDTLYVVMTPWLLGDDGRLAFRFPGTDRLADALHLQPLEVTTIGPDLLIKATPIWISSK